MSWLWGFGFASFCEPGNSVVMGISHLLFYAPECLCDVSGIELRRWLSRVAGTPAIPDKLLYCWAVLAGSLNLDTFPVRECLLPALNDSLVAYRLRSRCASLPRDLLQWTWPIAGLGYTDVTPLSAISDMFGPVDSSLILGDFPGSNSVKLLEMQLSDLLLLRLLFGLIFQLLPRGTPLPHAALEAALCRLAVSLREWRHVDARLTEGFHHTLNLPNLRSQRTCIGSFLLLLFLKRTPT